MPKYSVTERYITKSSKYDAYSGFNKQPEVYDFVITNLIPVGGSYEELLEIEIDFNDVIDFSTFNKDNIIFKEKLPLMNNHIMYLGNLINELGSGKNIMFLGNMVRDYPTQNSNIMFLGNMVRDYPTQNSNIMFLGEYQPVEPVTIVHNEEDNTIEME